MTFLTATPYEAKQVLFLPQLHSRIMPNNSEDEIFTTLMNGTINKFIRLNLSKNEFSIVRMGGYEG
jgi:hypothetical protein